MTLHLSLFYFLVFGILRLELALLREEDLVHQEASDVSWFYVVFFVFSSNGVDGVVTGSRIIYPIVAILCVPVVPRLLRLYFLYLVFSSGFSLWLPLLRRESHDSMAPLISLSLCKRISFSCQFWTFFSFFILYFKGFIGTPPTLPERIPRRNLIHLNLNGKIRCHRSS